MNGAHAELFTFCLYEELQSVAKNGGLTPLKLMDYYFVNDTAIEPGIRFYWPGYEAGYFDLEGGQDGFVLYCSLDHDENQPRFVDFLVERAGFMLTERRIERKCAHSDIWRVIKDLRLHLTAFTEGEDHNA